MEIDTVTSLNLTDSEQDGEYIYCCFIQMIDVHKFFKVLQILEPPRLTRKWVLQAQVHVWRAQNIPCLEPR